MIAYDKKIAIIGGGPGGLTLARLLQLNKLNVHVYERDINPSTRVQGSPLDMHKETGWAALEHAGLIENFLSNVRTGADKKIIVDKNAQIVFSDHNDHSVTGNPEIDRGALRKVLLESLTPGTVIWNSQFVSMKKQDAGWLMQFKNGSSAYADLVVGADGANSRIRPYLTEIRSFYTGITMVEINVENASQKIPQISSMLNGGKIMALGNEQCILGGQKEDDKLGFYFAFKPSENWQRESMIDFSDRSQVMSWIDETFGGWNSLFRQIPANAMLPVIPRSIYCVPLDQTWVSQANLTLLGDAAHVMPPFAGEGANTSMFDAVELVRCLTSDAKASVHEAISSYESSMRTRAAVAAEMSLKNGEMMFGEDGLERMLGLFGINQK